MRKLATAAAVSLALASGGAFGLGLGDIEMRSALNQPMNAEIPLTSVKAGELDGMIVKLADEDAFARAGIERTSVLTDLRFTVEEVGGRPVVRIESRRAVTEPFLNFLLEVDWPQGRMVREYTVLLDPPVFMTQGASTRDEGADRRAVTDADSALVAPAPIERTADAGTTATDAFEVELVGEGDEVSDGALIGGDEGDVVSLDDLGAAPASTGGDVVSLTDLEAPNTDAVAERAARAASDAADAASGDLFEVELVGGTDEVGDDAGTDRGARAAAPADAGAGDEGEIVALEDLDAPAGGATGGEEVTVTRGDTLFAIAERTAPNGVSVQQMMLALLEANRSSFINDNINLVRAGSILRVPQAAEARALSQAQALAEIGRQNDLWRQYRDNLRGNTGGTRLAAGPADAAEDSDAAGAASDEATDGLSEEARRILESAREEVRARDELSIVADDASSETTASATADETEGNEGARLGEINRKLQLAREELASARVEGDDLGEQADELQSTNENLDALVSLRQNEIAKLEAQLAAARDEAADTVADGGALDEAADEAAEGAADVVADAGDAASEAADAAGDAAEGAGEALASAADAAGEEAENALSAAGETLESVDLVGADSDADGTLLADAGGAIESGAQGAMDAGTDAAAATAAAAGAAASGPWYQTLLQDKTRLAIAGAGGLGLLGVLGALFWRRRRAEDDDDLLAGFDDDDVQFIDDDEAAALQAEVDDQTVTRRTGAAGAAADADVPDGFGEVEDAASPSGSTGKVAAAGAAVAGGAAALGGAFAGRGGDAAPDTGEDGLDKDDTISEADVYLAYGLHGQAEELLTKAIDRKPENMEYAEKLLQTYHAQGNAEGYQRAATDYHARFGGEANPAWADIAAKGRELRPDVALFAAGAAGVAAVGTGRLDGEALGDEDFLSSAPEEGGVSSSVSRDFGAAEDALDFDMTDVGGLTGALPGTDDTASADDLEDETALMDQSLDPAFAFDEGDLEATGDFSQIAGELAAENDGSIDFPGFDDAGSALDGAKDSAGDALDGAAERATGAATGAAAGLAAGVAGVAGAAGAAFGLGGEKKDAPSAPDDQMPLGELPDGSSLEDALTLDELDLDGTATAANDAGDDTLEGFGANTNNDELTLDLDELSAGLDMDATAIDGGASFDEIGDELSAELDESSAKAVDGLGLADLTSDEELLMDATGAPLDSADEMDTMMDLAKAYIDMGDKDSASNALGEIVKGGNAEQVSEAETLLRKIS